MSLENKQLDMFEQYYCGKSVETIKLSILNALRYWLGKDQYTATNHDWFMATAYSIRNRIVERWMRTQNEYYRKDAKRVYYLSLEFLIGKLMGNNLYNLGLYDKYSQALSELGFDIETIIEMEKDAGLGNGGLGRLAACFLDSMTTMELPAYGYGIRYEFGIFRQVIKDGCQVEEPDEWLKNGNPWEIVRPEFKQEVWFGGNVEEYVDEYGKLQVRWNPGERVIGIPYDIPIVGYGTDNVNTLRLWSARAHEQFDFQLFNYGDYINAVHAKTLSETISKVLYPNDNLIQGKKLRLKQEYFFVSCTIKDIVRRYKKMHRDFTEFSDKVAIQLNDTHPALGIVELMRLLIDREGLSWETAWDITVKTFSYTNHTLLPEALETWDVSLVAELLPRHLQIINEINYRFLKQVNVKFPGDSKKLEDMSIFAEKPVKRVRMAYLAMVGSHRVNGVSKLHSELIKETLAPGFYKMWPDRFTNVTNGITPRLWLLKSNRDLADIISDRIGDDWITDLDKLRELEKYINDPVFIEDFASVKLRNKRRLAQYIWEHNGIRVNPNSIFDIQVKRLHEYKRQLMNALNIVNLYIKLKENPDMDFHPRTFIFAAKAAPGYMIAKLIIRFINSIGDVINNDLDIKDRLKVVFLADYKVSLAEKIIPAADVSEQISTAGLEASGTGNMKFALNGAIIIGTLDGANIEIMKQVGKENIYIFGKTAEEIKELKRTNTYNPWYIYNSNKDVKAVIDLIKSGFFTLGDKDVFMPLVRILLDDGDKFFVLADFEDYFKTHLKIDKDYRDRETWIKRAMLNTIRMGYFSSDRSIREYAENIWNIKPVKLRFDPQSPIPRPVIPDYLVAGK